ncbi:DUF1430 domain-containing protein [Lacticaseibacillus zeae]|uniref:DUF1430 domain-containing protein n=1 Tax=Lacticaseibacillus zeae subsp. silagei TaxID=3068307 RepID=A0ABD7Z7V7_LACZE|nr:MULTISPECIES: DUF1430 domain-containing protein [Lacticaseibacillus]MDE3316093.1 DUF1430 domain-containing protein [Lacticaseibacillus zeae]WLV83133.1 DUF1430 domain-containing protein [Lacticaseibacillus sp. NCIMB 15475]WLV85882.1 DUF1430 domain-containing protein [Lacticaseibacillus sp. NCIMB 15474]
MKRIVSVFLSLMVLLASLFVINIFQTNDQIRVENIESTPASFKIYLANATKSSQATLSFFEQLAKKHHASIVRTDFPNQTVLKSAVVDQSSFPYTNFFQNPQPVKLFEKPNATYTQAASSKGQPHIPVFGKSINIRLQNMAAYFKNGDKSANGIYTIIPATGASKDAITKEFAAFFDVPESELLTPKTQSEKEYVNRDLLMYAIAFGVLALLSLLGVLALAMGRIKPIGVWKIVGLSTRDILLQLYRLPIITTLASSVLVLAACYFYFDYFPKGFWTLLGASQLAVLMIFVIAILIVLVLIRSIKVVRFLKNAISFKLGTGLLAILKAVMIILTTVLLIGSLANIKDIVTATKRYNQVAEVGKKLTINSLGFEGEALKNFELNNGKNEARLGAIFSQLDTQLGAEFISGGTVYPRRNLTRYPAASTFKPQDAYQVVRVNQNVLRSLNLSTKKHLSNQFLIPISRKNDRHIKLLSQLLAYDRLSEAEQKKTTPGQLKVALQYYTPTSEKAKYFSNDGKWHATSNPIFEVINPQKIDYKSQNQLLTADVSNPLRITNTKQNRQKLKTMTNAQKLGGIELRFATIGSILNNETDSSRLGLQISAGLLIITFLISLIVSAFASFLYFETHKFKLSVLRVLGIKLVDRYQQIIGFLLLMYVTQIIVAFMLQKSALAIVVGLILAACDLLVSFAMLYHEENKNIVQVLKGE